MLELEHVFGSDLLENATITYLDEIENKHCSGFVFDLIEERSFFIKEQFATFSCSEFFVDNCCEFKLISQIPCMDHYAWAIFDSYNVSIVRGDTFRSIYAKQTYVSQSMSFELLKDFGYFQLICLPEKIFHDGAEYRKFNILTCTVYRDMQVKNLMVFPFLITIRPKLNTTYVPMVVGQFLQIFCSELDRLTTCDSLDLVPGMKKSFSLSRNNHTSRLQASTYKCVSNEGGVLYVENFSVIIPEIIKSKSKAYIKIHSPFDDFSVYVEGIDFVQIECLSENYDRWVWDESDFDIEFCNGSIFIWFKNNFKSISVILNNDVCEVVVDNTLGDL